MNIEQVQVVKKKVRILKKGEDNSNLKYWLRLSKLERLMELEQLRQQYIKWKYGNQQGFQRVYRIIKRA
jgi:hypothetical protein